MHRREFFKICSLLGIALPSASLLTACGSSPSQQPASPSPIDAPGSNPKHVVIIGAGAAGLTAGYSLSQAGVSFQILEASPRHGGRVKKNDSMLDFPLDLGGEWIHEVNDRVGPTVLNELSGTSDATNLANPWRPQTGAMWDGRQLHQANREVQQWVGDWRFTSSTWFDFFDQFIVPAVADKILYNQAVSRIDSSSGKILVTCNNGEQYQADHIIVTVPLKILQDGDIEFVPELPQAKQQAMAKAVMTGGMKVFIEFNDRFYPDVVALPVAENGFENEALFYNVALDKGSDKHVLGMFCHGEAARQFTQFNNEADLMAYILDLLDAMFDGQARLHYAQHIVQNWLNEPYIRGTYSDYNADESAAYVMAEAIGNKIFFAGEAYAGDNWGFVHTAARSGRRVAEQIAII